MYLTEQKQCTKCKQYLELNNFYFRNHKALRSQCKTCIKQINTKNIKKKIGTLSLWLTRTLADSKGRAKEKNLEHNLTKEWILNNLPTHCPVLNIKLSFTGDTYNSPSLDRFDNSKGYTTDNVRIISHRANTLKSNATIEELEAIVRYMKNEIN